MANAYMMWTRRKQEMCNKVNLHNYECIDPGVGDCQNTGTAYYKCNRCENETTGEGEYGDHSWEVEGTNPGTCQEESRIFYKCSICGEYDTYVGDLGDHKWVDNSSEPTCTSGGWSGVICSICTESRGEPSGEALGHDVRSFGITDNENNVIGFQSYCERCGEVLGVTPVE